MFARNLIYLISSLKNLVVTLPREISFLLMSFVDEYPALSALDCFDFVFAAALNLLSSLLVAIPA